MSSREGEEKREGGREGEGVGRGRGRGKGKGGANGEVCWGGGAHDQGRHDHEDKSLIHVSIN